MKALTTWLRLLNLPLKKTREDEAAVSKLESSTSEKHLDPSAVSRGSSLDRDDNSLLTLAGGKITDYRKMAEAAIWERVVDIQSSNFDRSFKPAQLKTYPVSGGELNPANVDSEIEAFAQLGVSRGLDSKEAHYSANLYGSNVLKVFALAHSLEQAPGLSLARHFVTSLCNAQWAYS